jgi:hypothetical protein
MLIIGRTGAEPDAKERFLAVMNFYMSGWHIKPKGYVTFLRHIARIAGLMTILVLRNHTILFLASSSGVDISIQTVQRGTMSLSKSPIIQ